MDQKDLNPSSDNSDLSSQYQDILEKYSQQLANKNANPEAPPSNPEPVTAPPEPPPPMPSETPPVPENNPPFELPPSPPQESVPPTLPPEPQPMNPESVERPPADSEPVIVPPVVTTDTSDEIPLPPKKTSSFFKVLFFLSLVLFLGVAAMVAYTFFIEPQNSVKLDLSEETLVDVTPAPTVVTGPVCELNDKTYPVGESFTATDNCNTCTCGEDLIITCTDNACPSVSPTESSTVSATPTTGE